LRERAHQRLNEEDGENIDDHHERQQLAPPGVVVEFVEHHLVGHDDANGVNVVACDMEAHLFAVNLLLRGVRQAVEASQVYDESLDQSVSYPHEEQFDSITPRFKSKFVEHRVGHEA